MSGKLIAGWNIALTEDELRLLADRDVMPTQIRPEHLIYFEPLADEKYAEALLDANKTET